MLSVNFFFIFDSYVACWKSKAFSKKLNFFFFFFFFSASCDIIDICQQRLSASCQPAKSWPIDLFIDEVSFDILDRIALADDCIGSHWEFSILYM